MRDELIVFVSTRLLKIEDMQFENQIIEGDNRAMLGMQSLTIFKFRLLSTLHWYRKHTHGPAVVFFTVIDILTTVIGKFSLFA